jgi:hypothetical protein
MEKNLKYELHCFCLVSNANSDTDSNPEDLTGNKAGTYEQCEQTSKKAV